MSKAQLRDTYEYKNFNAVIEFKDRVIDKWRQQNVIGDTDFETLKLTFEKEYKIKGLEEFFEALYGEIYGDERVQ